MMAKQPSDFTGDMIVINMECAASTSPSLRVSFPTGSASAVLCGQHLGVLAGLHAVMLFAFGVVGNFLVILPILPLVKHELFAVELSIFGFVSWAMSAGHLPTVTSQVQHRKGIY
jgi:hypothetical protein